ncbi:hypothetical protein [Pseudomonas japonica]|uniref:hypothetical protein n=1 Tax=Pseudomonas japonica TaxID=256466 RepID=UPI0015E33F94|nr:hypothetical protein [Pseudomonas japonica]MBA1245878.1 hypothetical protein [Pseudomonas japonica]
MSEKYDLPLCPNRYVIAVEAVRGKGAVLRLLKEHLRLDPAAEVVFSTYSGSYWLRLNESDRWQNHRVGMLEAVSAMPFLSGDILKQEIETWSAADTVHVVDAHALNALRELGLGTPDKV